MSDNARPRIEVTIAAPVDVVWDALRSKDKIRHWMGWDYEGLPGEIDLIFFTDTVENASARTLTLHGGDEFRLEPHGEGTRVTLTRVPVVTTRTGPPTTTTSPKAGSPSCSS